MMICSNTLLLQELGIYCSTYLIPQATDSNQHDIVTPVTNKMALVELVFCANG